MAKPRLWHRATGEDGRQHVLYNPERERHQLTARCLCVPRVERAVVIHATYTKDAEGQDAERKN